MKIRFYILISIFLHSLVSSGQIPDWTWAKNYGSFQSSQGRSIATDENGNICVTGTFSSPTIDFDSITLTNKGTVDAYIAKLDSLGNIIWAKSFGGTDWEVPTSITVDKYGNIFITGYFMSHNLSIDSIIITNPDTLSWNANIFTIKYDSSGNLKWAKIAGGINDDYAYGITTDAIGNVYLVGTFLSPTMYFDTNTITNAGFCNILIAKYDPSGNIIWAKCAGGNSWDSGNSIASDENDNIYITGNYSSPVITFDSITLTNAGSENIFISKYNTSGNVIWARSAGGNLYDSGNGITLDTYKNIIITGNFSSHIITFGSFILNNIFTSDTTSDIFVAKYDSLGNVLWAKCSGGIEDEYSFGITTDAGCNIYLTGLFSSSTINFNGTILSNAGLNDFYILKYDLLGNEKWAKSGGGSKEETGYGIIADYYGNIYLTGYFKSDSVSFDSITLSLNGIANVYIAKLKTNIPSGIENIFTDSDSFVVYPSPTSSDFTIIVPASARQIQISNSLGQIIQQVIVDRQENFSFTLRKSGLYFIQVMTDKKTVTKKIIVSK